MPTITVTLTEDEARLLDWDAKQNGITVSAYVSMRVPQILAPLRERFLKANRSEVSEVISKLSADSQDQLIAFAKTLIGK